MGLGALATTDDEEGRGAEETGAGAEETGRGTEETGLDGEDPPSHEKTAGPTKL